MDDRDGVRLPASISLDLTEVRTVLEALDDAEALTQPGTDLQVNIRTAIVLITRKVWPDLGDLLDEDEG